MVYYGGVAPPTRGRGNDTQRPVRWGIEARFLESIGVVGTVVDIGGVTVGQETTVEEETTAAETRDAIPILLAAREATGSVSHRSRFTGRRTRGSRYGRARSTKSRG
ncbi:hypothetical protein [Halomicrococcus sp. SG-WS-1]|uniref:hypothetical protein n=1 Tax=Halomicrococcus sp. SG-WS-1 TaxID=3439057 RepID=UPI003F791724